MGRGSGGGVGAGRLAIGALAVVATIGAAVWLLLARSSSLDEKAEAESRARSIEIVGLRAELSYAVHRYIDAVVDARGATAPTEAAFAGLDATLADISGRLELLAEGDGEAAGLAERDLEVIADLGVAEPTLELFPLEGLRFDIILADEPRVPSAGPLQEAADLVSLPWLVLLDARSVDLTSAGVELPAALDDYLSVKVGFLREDPGWTGPDAGSPFDGGFLLVDRVEEQLPELLADLDGAPGLDDVWAYDQWLIATSASGGPDSAPLTIQQLSMASVEAAAAQQAAVLDAVADAAGSERARAAGTFAAGWVVPSAIGLVLLGVGLTAASAVGFVRSQRRMRDELFRDPLTGAHNRRFAERTIAERCRTDRHHVVVVVDLDRFKLVNDTYGHDVGDALLVAASDRLRTAVDDIVGAHPGADGEVVRLGGDEFLVAVHAPDRISVDEVLARLREIGGPVAVGSDNVELEASFGASEHRGPTELTELVTTADLAAYEDKRARSSEREREAGRSAEEDRLARHRALAIRAALAEDDTAAAGLGPS